MQCLHRHSLGRQGCFCSPGASKARQWQHPRLLVKAAGGNGAEKSSDKKLDVEKQREIAKMLLTTQKNMLALNNSRVKVQEELAVANRRITDLEREVERLRLEATAAQQAAAEAKRAPPQVYSAPRGASPASPAQYMQQQMPQQQMPHQQQQQMPQQAHAQGFTPQQQQQPQPPQQQMHMQQQQQQRLSSNRCSNSHRSRWRRRRRPHRQP
ncbi:hypothetical protein COO60DRAFT_1699761 [Scenedesmus sp. NREL 46B-D3]|nr:hypothetical protein COO60DRAFT_1699761 [Scenedesmus sp. NREL 46B-D3]